MTGTKNKWIGWVIAGFFILGGIAHHKLTVKDLAREASGQQATPSDATNEEKQGVALVSEELQAGKTFQLRLDAFKKTDTFVHLNKTASMANPTVASRSLSDITDYCNARKELRDSLASVFVRANVNMTMYIFNYFEASHQWCIAETDLYNFVLNPALKVHVDPADGTLIFPTTADVNTFEDHLKATKEAREQFLQAEKTLRAEIAKEQKEDGVTNSDYGF